uniref:Uncharacterized protein n=1 Tax=Amphimedon queenslandica TaxID=400682 RepID=A0A1X7T485_AMPQE
MTNRFSCYPFFFGSALFLFPKFKKPEIHSVVYTRSDSLDFYSIISNTRI